MAGILKSLTLCNRGALKGLELCLGNVSLPAQSRGMFFSRANREWIALTL
jgi:hypothetical protein